MAKSIPILLMNHTGTKANNLSAKRQHFNLEKPRLVYYCDTGLMNMTLGPQLFAYMFDNSSMMMKQFFKKQNIVKKIKQVLTHLISISIVPDFLFSFLFSCLVYCSSRKVIRLNCWVYRNVTVLISHAVAYLFLSALGGDISSGSYIVSQPQIFTHFYK